MTLFVHGVGGDDDDSVADDTLEQWLQLVAKTTTLS
jgi:hypothetical protein